MCAFESRRIFLNEREREFLKENYTDLLYDAVSGRITGVLNLNREFRAINIKGKYEIEIILETKGESILPKVRETGEKILRIANRKKMNIDDLHLNGMDGELCLMIPLVEKDYYPSGFKLTTFMDYIESFFYWIGYFERYEKEPWKGQGHGLLGYMELFSDERYRVEVKNYIIRRKRFNLLREYRIWGS